MSANKEEIPVGCGVAMSITVFIAINAWTFTVKAWQDDTKAWRLEAVRRGAAEWVMNPRTGESEWRWKEQPPTPTHDQE